MLTEDLFIEKAKRIIETHVGWGMADTWTNQDFNELCEKIHAKTGVNLSPTTLKRVWGRVQYNSVPSTTTLDTLVHFIGFENWRDFKNKSDKENAEEKSPIPEKGTRSVPALRPKSRHFVNVILLSISLVLFLFFALYLLKKEPVINPDDYTFSSKTIVTEGVPNSVVFNFNATKSPYDSIIIQQSWNQDLQTKLPKSQKQHTSIYYYPNNFQAKLIVGGQIVKEHNLLIKSNGWVPIIERSPVPVYLKKEDVIGKGTITASIDLIKSKNISFEPSPPNIRFINVDNFGEIYTDDFVFEASLKNDYKEGAGICQNTRILLLCVGNVISIPLCAKGCVSDIDLVFTEYYKQGQETDLSAFGTDFTDFVKLKILSKNGNAQIFLNENLAYTVSKGITKTKIIGITFQFQGTGSVDYAKLSNGEFNFEDGFDTNSLPIFPSRTVSSP